jgi:hypothetical protein
MPVVEINLDPSARQLRQFGASCAVLLPLAAWLWGASGAVIGSLAAAGAAIAVAAWIRPRTVRPIFLALSLAAAPIGIVVGEAALLALFLAVFLPISLAMRARGRDPLERRTSPLTTSYWRRRESTRTPASYYRQF